MQLNMKNGLLRVVNACRAVGRRLPGPLRKAGRRMVQPWKNLYHKFSRNWFLFEELVRRDFKQKYKRTVLGMGWSILSPLLQLLVMRVIFTQFFGRDMPHYTTYLFAGNLLFSFYRESTTGGMNALMSNANIFTKINIPKYFFVLTKNVSSIINFGITLIVFFVFAAFDGIAFTWKFIMLIYPIITLVLFNIGIGLLLSALYVFFRDTQYLYDIFTLLLSYLSAIFYYVDKYPPEMQRLFLINPVFCHIKYFRTIVIDGMIPDFSLHMICLGFALLALLVGGWMYKSKNQKFLYYV